MGGGKKGDSRSRGGRGASNEEGGNQVGKFKVKHGRTPPRNTLLHRYMKLM